MSCIKVIASSLELPTTLIELLKGSKGLYLQSNCVKDVPGVKPPTKPIFQHKDIKGKGQTVGNQFVGPILYIRPSNMKDFTKNYKIELSPKIGKKSVYRFKTPPQEQIMTKKIKQSVFIKLMEGDEEMETLRKIDNMICMGTEYLMLAEFAKYDFNECKTDEELINGLFKKISPEHYDKLLECLDPEYYKLIVNPPIWEKSEEIAKGNHVIDNSSNPDKYLSLFNIIFATGTTKKLKKDPKPLQKDVIANLFDDGKNTSLMSFLNCAENNIVPQIKKVRFSFEKDDKKGEQETREIMDARFVFFVERSGEYNNPNFPKSMYTKKMTKDKRLLSVTGDEFEELIGANIKDSAYTFNEGFMWCFNNVDITKYQNFQIHSNWNISTLMLKKSNKSFAEDFSVDMSYFDEMDDDDDDDGPSTTQTTTPAQPIRAVSSEEAVALLDDDL